MANTCYIVILRLTSIQLTLRSLPMAKDLDFANRIEAFLSHVDFGNFNNHSVVKVAQLPRGSSKTTYKVTLSSNVPSTTCTNFDIANQHSQAVISNIKIRICDSIEQANNVALKVNSIYIAVKTTKLVPICESHGKYVISRFITNAIMIDSWRSTKNYHITPHISISRQELCTQLGRTFCQLYNTSNSINMSQFDDLQSVKQHWSHQTFKNRVEKLPTFLLSDKLKTRLIVLYKELFRKHRDNLKICFDFRDIAAKNFLLVLSNKNINSCDDRSMSSWHLCYVDECGIGTLYGLGISRLYRFDNDGIKDVISCVVKGYNQQLSLENYENVIKFPDNDYLTMLSLFEIVAQLRRSSNPARQVELIQKLNVVLQRYSNDHGNSLAKYFCIFWRLFNKNVVFFVATMLILLIAFIWLNNNDNH